MKNLKLIFRLGVLFTGTLFVSSGLVRAQNATLTWDPSSTGTGSYGSGTWDVGTTSDWATGTGDTVWQNNSFQGIFGGTNTGSVATVTLVAPISADSLVFNTSGYDLVSSAPADTLTITGGNSITVNNNSSEEIDAELSGGSVITPGSPGSGTAGSSLRVVVNTGSTLTLGGGVVDLGGGRTFSFGGGGTLNLDGSSNYYGFSSLNAGGGAIVQNAGSIVSGANGAGGPSFFDKPNVELGNGTAGGGTGTYTINGAGAVLNAFNGDVGNANNYTLAVENGTASIGNQLNIGNNSGTALTDAVTVSGTGNLIVNSSTSVVTSGTTGVAASLNVNGGVVDTLGGISLGGNTASSSSAALNVSGGILAVGQAGITTTGDANTITLSGGTVSGTQGWVSNANMTLSNANGGVTFQTSDIGSTIAGSIGGTNSNGYTQTGAPISIGLTGNLSGTGGLKVTGSGFLSLSGVNTFSGVAEVTSGAELTLDSNTALGALSTLTLDSGSLVDLDFSGVDTIFSLDVNGVAQASGFYTAADLGGDGDDNGQGGELFVTAPEPSTYVMLGMGAIALLAIGARRRRMQP